MKMKSRGNEPITSLLIGYFWRGGVFCCLVFDPPTCGIRQCQSFVNFHDYIYVFHALLIVIDTSSERFARRTDMCCVCTSSCPKMDDSDAGDEADFRVWCDGDGLRSVS